MQHIIYVDGAPAAFLPALYNWQSWEATPIFDEETGLLLEPNPPYLPIGIMHNAQANKYQKFNVTMRHGSQVMLADMRYETWANHVLKDAAQ